MPTSRTDPARSPSPPSGTTGWPTGLKQGLAAVVGIVVLTVEWLLLLSDGITIAGVPLADVPAAAETTGITRLLGADEFVIAAIWMLAVAIAYGAAAIVRAALEDRWVTKVGSGGKSATWLLGCRYPWLHWLRR